MGADMSDDLIGRGVVEIVGNTDDVTAKIAKVGDDVERMARRAQKSGKDASDGVKQIGDGAQKATDGLDASTRRFEANLKRQIASMSGAKRGTEEYVRAQAKLKGADLAALEPVIRQWSSVKRNADEAAAATRRFADSQRFLRGLESQANSVGKTASQLARMKAEQLGVAQEAAPMIARMEQAERAANRTGGAFSRLSGYVKATVAAFGVREIVRYADSWTELQNRLRLVTDSQAELATATDDVFRIAMTTNQELSSTAEVYQRFAQNAQALGLSQERVAEVTETVSKAVAISGASAQAAQAALTQFGQALASGVLRGEEFNSVMEQTPGLAQAIARGLGVSIGELRKMAAEGKITTDVLMDGLTNVRDSVSDEFGTRVVTLSQSFTNLGNAVTRYIGELNTSTSATSTVGRVIEGLANNIDMLGNAAAAAAVIFAGRFVGSIVAANGGLIAMSRSAMAAAGSIATLRAAGGAILAVFGGPAGIAVSVGLAATALLTMGGSAKTASINVDELTKSINDLTEAQSRQAIQGYEELYKEASDEAKKYAAQVEWLNVQLRMHPSSKEADNWNRALVEARGNYDTASQKAEEYLRKIQALEEQIRSLNSTASDDSIVKTSDAALKYLERLADQSITAGLKTQREQLEALVKAGKLEFSEEDLAKARRFADHIDRMSASSKGAAKATNELANAMKSLLDTHLPQNAALAELHKNLGLLQAAQKAGMVSGLDYAKALESINLAYAKQVNDLLPESVKKAKEAVKAAQDQTKALQQQLRTFGMAESAVLDLAAAETQAAIAKLEAEKATLVQNEATAERVQHIDAEIAKLRELQELQTGMAGLQRQVEWKAAEKAAWEEWSRDVEQIFGRVGQSLTDAIFDGGKSGKELLRDLFKGLTFNILINPIMQGLQGWVTQNLGGMFGYQNPQQGGGVLGTAQNLYSGYNAVSGGLSGSLGNAAQWLGQRIGSEALTSFGLGLSGATAATGIASIGAGLGASLGTTIGTSAAAMTTTTFSASLAGGAAAGGAAAGGAAAGGAAAGGAAAGGAAGLGATLGAALPWVGGALAVGSMFGLFGDDTPKTRHGQRARVDFAGDIFDITSTDDRQPGAESSVQQLVKQAVQSANAVFQQAGIDAAIDTFYAMTESSVLGDRQGVASGGMLRIGDALRQIGIRDSSDMTFAGFGGWSEADMLPRLATDIQLSILEAFQSAGVMSDLLDGVHIRGLGEEAAAQLATTIQTIVSEVAAFQDAIVSLPFANLQGLAFEAARGLIAAAGGLENLNAGLSSYYDTYYSEAEKLDRISAQVQKALEGVGLVMPDVTQGADSAKAAFRALFESLDPATEAGQQAVAAMLGVNQAFAQLVDGLDEMASAAEQAALKARQAAWETLVSAGESAFAALTRSVSAEKARLQKESDAIAEALRNSISAASQTVNELTSLTGRLTSTLQRMTGQLDPAANLAWAQERIDRALSVAKLTGVMPQGADFEQALQIVANPSTKLYSSFEDYQADFLKTANTISALNELADGQLSMERRSLAALEDQLAQSQAWYQAEMERLDLMLENQLKDLEIATGQYEAILTIPQALERIAAAIAAIEISAPPPSYSAPGVFNDQLYLEAKLAELVDGGIVPVDFSGPMTTDYLRDFMAAAGMTPEQHYQRYGKDEDIDEYIRQLRGYASGTAYVPKDMPVNVHQGEIIIDPRSADILRRYGIGVQGGGNSVEMQRALQEQVSELRQQNRYLYEIVKSGKRTALNTEDTAMAIAHGDSDGVVVLM